MTDESYDLIQRIAKEEQLSVVEGAVARLDENLSVSADSSLDSFTEAAKRHENRVELICIGAAHLRRAELMSKSEREKRLRELEKANNCFIIAGLNDTHPLVKKVGSLRIRFDAKRFVLVVSECLLILVMVMVIGWLAANVEFI